MEKQGFPENFCCGNQGFQRILLQKPGFPEYFVVETRASREFFCRNQDFLRILLYKIGFTEDFFVELKKPEIQFKKPNIFRQQESENFHRNFLFKQNLDLFEYKAYVQQCVAGKFDIYITILHCFVKKKSFTKVPGVIKRKLPMWW